MPGTDISSWATANITSKLSFAGTWVPADITVPTSTIVVPFWNVARLGADQFEGVVMAGWINESNPALRPSDVIPSRAAVFEQQPDGTLQEATAKIFGDSTTYGAADVITADFNNDGKDDILLPAYNETPFKQEPSVAYVSDGDSLRKITIADRVLAHHTNTYVMDGTVRAISQSFADGGAGGGHTVVYQWTGSNFSATNLGEVGGMSIAVGQFTSNGDWYVVVGDSSGGLGHSYVPNQLLPYAYKFNNQNPTLPAIAMPKPYFNDKPEYAAIPSYWDPVSKTHTPRMLATDLNNDGLLDVVAFATIWKNGNGLGHQRGTPQLMLNRDNMVFADDTAVSATTSRSIRVRARTGRSSVTAIARSSSRRRAPAEPTP